MVRITINRKTTSVARSPKTRTIRRIQRGDAGLSADNFLSYIAGVTLSGHRAVCVNASGQLIYADHTITGHAHKVLGITTGAASVGAPAEVQTSGELTEIGWSWTEGLPIYVSVNGALTQVAPTTGFSLVIGFAVTATRIFIDIKLPIMRG